MILSFMSVERFMLIAAPLKRHRSLTPQAAFSSMIAIWIFGITLALIPAIHWRSSTRYYGVNGLCFPLHIDDPFFIGWQYSAFIFLGLNFVGWVCLKKNKKEISFWINVWVAESLNNWKPTLELWTENFHEIFFIFYWTKNVDSSL